MLMAVPRSILAPVLTLLMLLGFATQASAVQDPDAPPTPAATAAKLSRDDLNVGITRRLADALERAHSPLFVLDLDRRVRAAAAERSFRASIRAEQTDIYLLAGDPRQERAVEAHLNPGLATQVRDAAGALRAIWRLAGVDDITGITPHFVRDSSRSLPVPTLVGLYHGAAGAYGMDWSYLAAINFVETDFGRVLGPSVTGAMGPMQFEPATWEEYGAGANIMSPHDSIQIAAKYLNANGAPGDMAQAIYAYNPTWDYVEAVSRYAAAIRRDPSWYWRLYYWSTAESP